MTKAVIDDGGSCRARICLAVVTSTSISPYIGVIRLPARSATVTSRRLEGNGWVCTRRGRPAFITPPWHPVRRGTRGGRRPARGRRSLARRPRRAMTRPRRRRWARRRLASWSDILGVGAECRYRDRYRDHRHREQAAAPERYPRPVGVGGQGRAANLDLPVERVPR